MQPEDWPSVRQIYADGLATGIAAFMSMPPGWDSWDRGHLAIGRLVARHGVDIVGFAALSPTADT
jgi:phosphinothricin acetyltransferase